MQRVTRTLSYGARCGISWVFYVSGTKAGRSWRESKSDLRQPNMRNPFRCCRWLWQQHFQSYDHNGRSLAPNLIMMLINHQLSSMYPSITLAQPLNLQTERKSLISTPLSQHNLKATDRVLTNARRMERDACQRPKKWDTQFLTR